MVDFVTSKKRVDYFHFFFNFALIETILCKNIFKCLILINHGPNISLICWTAFNLQYVFIWTEFNLQHMSNWALLLHSWLWWVIAIMFKTFKIFYFIKIFCKQHLINNPLFHWSFMKSFSSKRNLCNCCHSFLYFSGL